MQSAYQLLVCLFLLAVLISTNVVASDLLSQPGNEAGNFIQFSEWRPSCYTPASNFRSKTSRSFAGKSTIYSKDTIFFLLQEIISRLGLPYRLRGTGDKGYDCSGFVWRVFYETGIEFKRTSVRTLWATFPEATENERVQFGTLVFFNRLKHVGIVRDAYSFYHASRSQGVVRSNFSGYWKKRIVGYRRALVPIGTQGKWRENEQGGWKVREDVKYMQDVIQRSAKLWQTIVIEIILPQRSRKIAAEEKP